MSTDGRRVLPPFWTVAVLMLVAPLVAVLAIELWRTPFPLSEAVAIFEDVVGRPPSAFLLPDHGYTRPLYYLSVSAIWHGAGSLDAALALLKVAQITPVVLLVTALVCHLRPRTPLDGAAAACAVGVLIGSPAFADNLELPMNATIVAMSIGLVVWELINRERARGAAQAWSRSRLSPLGSRSRGW